MNYSVGIDSEVISRFSEDKVEMYCKKLLSDEEVEYFLTLPKNRQLKFIASRFSCKEAIFKAIGCGIDEIKFREISILPNHNGKPTVKIAGYEVDVSITYAADIVTTIAIVSVL